MHSEKNENAVYHRILGDKLRKYIPGSDVEVINAGVDTDLLLDNHINHPSHEMHQLFDENLFNTLLFED